MAPYLKTMRVLWGAILSTVVILAGLLLAGIKAGEGGSRDPAFPWILGAVSVQCLALSFFLPKIIYKKAALRADLEIVNEPVPDALVAGFRQAAPTRRVFADPEAAVRRAAFTFQTPFILSLALSEAVGLMGFVLGFLGFEALVWAPFMAVSAALIAARFPDEKTILMLFEPSLGASIPRPPA